MNSAIKTLFQHQHEFIVSKIMFTASELGVFDLLKSEKLLTAGTIAERLGTSPTGMERLLDACVGFKFLRVERKENEGLYGNTDLADMYLAKTSPKSQYNYMKLFTEFVYPSMQYLPDAVREGKSQTQTIHGTSSNNIFDDLYRSKEELQRFIDGMGDAWSLYGREVMSAFDLSNFSLICDVGGGSGALAKEWISLYPNSTVTILDLPEVVERARKHFVSSQECQITFQEGDFFKDPVPEADLYILARVLHDWDDEKCVQLLTKLHKACKPGGGVLISEIILDENRTGPSKAHLYSMLMLVFTEGKERTASEFNGLLSAAGFKDIQVKKRSIYDAILGRK
ncbi:acetylserotonin O-methyltransferase-like [Elgaria multicarinata webbii]|uniref:acetylserotonin O-methyltransferase-like n=1 Tax=Elgaria multicarinata webbii TaxID=159646 RepID=UPI002FCD0701